MLVSSIPLTVIYYSKLSRYYKLLAIINIVFQVAVKFLGGANEGIFDIGIYIIVSIYIKIQVYPSKKINKKRKMKLSTAVLVVVIISILLNFFTRNIGGRTAQSFAFPTIFPNHYDNNALILEFIPNYFHETLAYLTVYLCEGYYGLSLATTLDWIPNWGSGYSSFIRNNLQELFNIDILQYSYQGRAERFGWGATKNWHTAYTWFANDVSFLGVPIIMFIFGWLLAKVYKDSSINKNPYAIILTCLLMLQVFYLPANSKLFNQPATFMLFWISLMLWIGTKKRNINRKH